jgi:hypothetical protein
MLPRRKRLGNFWRNGHERIGTAPALRAKFHHRLTSAFWH